MQELTARCACPPDHNLIVCPFFRLVKAANEGRQNVAILGVKVIPGAVEVRGHHTAIINAMLAVVALAEFDAGDFGDGVGLIRGLKCSCQKGGFAHRLRDGAGVDARRSKL